MKFDKVFEIMAGADFREYVTEMMRKAKAPIQSSLKSSINQKPIEVVNNDSNVIKSMKLTVQADEGFDWLNVSKGVDVGCSKATKAQNISESESDSETSDYSKDSN